MKAELELVNEMLSRLVLCTETATQLTRMLSERDGDFTDVSSLLNSDDESEETDAGATGTSDVTGTPDATASMPTLALDTADAVPPSAANDVTTTTPTPTLPAETTTQEVSVSSHAGAIIPIDPTGPHHLFVPGDVSLDGRVQVMYNKFIYDLPPLDATGQLYLVTRGRRVGIFATWTHTSPYVNRVKSAVYMKVTSLDEGIALMMEAIELKEARWVA